MTTEKEKGPNLLYIGQKIENIEICMKNPYCVVFVEKSLSDGSLTLNYYKTDDRFMEFLDDEGKGSSMNDVLTPWEIKDEDDRIMIENNTVGIEINWIGTAEGETQEKIVAGLFIPMTRIFHVFINEY